MRLLLVEDEKLTREGIKKSFQWSSLGIMEVEEAFDGIHALETAQRFQPDIVLTDIKMPRMNGVEFAFQIRSLYPDCKIIFMSGYADKQYLKAAISLKAISYVEKPLDMDELEEALQEAVSIGLKERQLSSVSREQLHASSSLMKQELALQLIREAYDEELLRKRLDWAGLQLPLKRPCATIIVKILPPNPEQEVLDSIALAGSEQLQRPLLAALKDELHWILHLFAADESGTLGRKDIGAAADWLSGELKRHPYQFAIAAGVVVQEASLLSRSYTSAVFHLQETFYKGPYCTVIATDNERAVTEVVSYQFDHHFVKDFREQLERHDFGQAERMLHSLHQGIVRLPGTLVNNVKEMYYQVLMELDKFGAGLGLSIFETEEESRSLWNFILGCSYEQEIFRYLQAKAEQLQQALAERGIGSKASKIVKYIHQHYSNDELSVQEISDHLQMTASYLISVFKEATGKTIRQYIMDYRMDKAKQLLKNDRLKISDIASQVGYKDGEYFAKIFRKATGMTPSEHRERYHS
ncbi:response regulator [Paenibacillus rigui]|uniref:DNA-binding response regulator n=1 Tax=Paenibacillus rigui TaxID=554312 RepID=A0A229URZ9_9BACL|nr:response regulator [Paenibacillus rigui]OXM86198.1 DNA-binding response regulator [Paenibacillus rigui]